MISMRNHNDYRPQIPNKIFAEKKIHKEMIKIHELTIYGNKKRREQLFFSIEGTFTDKAHFCLMFPSIVKDKPKYHTN